MAMFMVRPGTKSILGRSTWRSAGADTATMEFSDHLLDRDQNSTGLGMTVVQPSPAPPAVPPFRFEPKRTRIDWRMLHSIDVNHIVRDVDLDTLERLVGLVAYGDIEAEDTRHLSETNFLKIFRLAQLVIEYLLYVQDSLQACNTWLQSDRDRLEKYVAAARTRLRELDVHYKASKRELRRARRTVKTYEAMVALGKLPDADNSNVKSATPAQKQEATEQPVKPSVLELALQQEVQVLADRLTRTQLQLTQMRIDRDEMAGVIQEIDTAVKAKTAVTSSKAGIEQEVKALKEQLGKAQKDNRMLRSEKDDLTTKLEAATSQARTLQVEKEALLQEISTRATKEVSMSSEATVVVSSSPQLSDMLLDAEARNKALAAEVEELQGTVVTLQKQLMRAAKDAAKTEQVIPPSAPLMEMQRALTAAEASRTELAQRVAELEQELTDKRQLHAEDVRLMQEELTRIQAQLTETEYKLQQSQATQAQAGFIKVNEDTANTAVQQQLTTARAEQEMLRSKLAELSTANRHLDESLAKKDDDLTGAWRQITDLQAQLAASSAGRVKAQVEEFEKAAKVDSTSIPRTMIEDDAHPMHSPLPAGNPRCSPAADNCNNNSFKFAAGSLLAAKPVESIESHVHITSSPMAKAPGLLMAKSAPASPHHTQPISPAQAAAIKQDTMRHVAGYSPDALAILVEEELRILSEHPYEFMEDDEANFRSILPHKVQGVQHAGILSAQQHTASELAHARACSESNIMAAINAQVASFGLASDATTLTDREYAAAMMELNRRRDTKLAGMDAEKRDKLEFLRNAMLTHLELSKRHLEAGGLPVPQFPDLVGSRVANTKSLSDMDASLTPGAILPHHTTSSPAVKVHALLTSSQAGTAITAARDLSASVDSVVNMQSVSQKAAVNNPAHATIAETVSRSFQQATTHTSTVPILKNNPQTSAAQQDEAVIRSKNNPQVDSVMVSDNNKILANQMLEQASPVTGAQMKTAEQQSVSAATSPDHLAAGVKQILNQPLQRASTGGGLTKNSLVTVHSANALNASIRSAGTGKASVRDYSDDDDDDDVGLSNEKLSDEYAVDAVEGEMVDEGLLSDEDQGSSSPAAALPSHAGWNAGASLRGTDRVLSPSRLAKASVSQVPTTAATAETQLKANTVQPPLSKPGLQYDSDISDISDDIPLPSIRPLMMPANPPAMPQGSQQGSQQAATVKVPAGRPRNTTLQSQAANSWTTGAAFTGVQTAHKDVDDDFEVGSIHSFNPNSTTTSIKASSRPAMPGTAAAMHAGAWNSPNATARSRVSLLQQGDLQAGQWNETIRTIGSSVGDDSQVLQLDGMNHLPLRPAQGPWSSPAGTNSIAAVKAPDHLLNMHAKHLLRKDSFDTVSDVDFL